MEIAYFLTGIIVSSVFWWSRLRLQKKRISLLRSINKYESDKLDILLESVSVEELEEMEELGYYCSLN